MTIAVCGSLKFVDKLRQVEAELKKAGHTVYMPVEAVSQELYWSDDGGAERVAAKRAHDLISEHMRKMDKSDAILVVNETKRDIVNYVGANTFLEMGYAHYRKMPIYMLNPLPTTQDYIDDELKSFDTIILDGDVANLAAHLAKK